MPQVLAGQAERDVKPVRSDGQHAHRRGMVVWLSAPIRSPPGRGKPLQMARAASDSENSALGDKQSGDFTKTV